MAAKTLTDIAKLTGITAASVSRALSGSSRISEKTRLRVQSVAKRLNYTPNGLAQALKFNRTNSIGIIAGTLSNPFFTQVIEGLNSVLYKNEYMTLIYLTDVVNEPESASLRKLINKRIDGLVILHDLKDEKDISLLMKTGVPVVFFEKQSLEGKVDCVNIDNEKGGYMLTKHLISLGHKRIAYLGFESAAASLDRLAGYKRALRESGLPVIEQYIQLGYITKTYPVFVNNLLGLQEKPTAFVVFNDLEAIHVIRYLKSKGVNIPGDIAVAGFDNIELSEVCEPPLTTVNNFPYETGIKIGEFLFNRINSKNKAVQSYTFTPELVIRKSCGE